MIVKRRRGRPTRAESTARALARLVVDPSTIDPRAILAGIAADLSAPASARVSACRALLAGDENSRPDGAGGDVDTLTKRAITLLAAGRPN